MVVFSLVDCLQGAAEHLQRYLNCDSATVLSGCTYSDLWALVARISDLNSLQHLDQLDNSSMSADHCWCFIDYLNSCLHIRHVTKFISQLFSSFKLVVMAAGCLMPSVLYHCWLGVRKNIRPIKNWVMGYWRGYLSGVWCKWFAYGPANATATPSSLASVKSRMVYLSGASLPRFSWKKGC